jgi:heme ABC exporter ATP-binding subunit CcmA
VIETEDLVKGFGRKKVIDGVNLKIEKGDFLAIFGPNGAGKTTLIKLLSTLFRPSSGRITIDGLDTKKKAAEVRQRIGVLTHSSFLYDELSAKENLRFYMRMYNVQVEDERVKGLLGRVKLLHRINDMVGTYSRGMKQRLAIARAIAHNPKILLLDEPYTGLDLNGSEILSNILSEHLEQGKTIVMATHDVELGYEVSKRLAVLFDGKIATDRNKQDVGMNEFKEMYKGLLGAR